MDTPSNPQEAWTQRAISVRRELAGLDDAELLERVRRRQIDLTFGLWDELQARKLDAAAVLAIMDLLAEPPDRAGDDFLHYYHAAAGLLALTAYPCEMGGGGDFNLTASRLASDFHGEPARQGNLREFWAGLVAHCAARGCNLEREPAWPAAIPTYRSEARYRLAGGAPPGPTKVRATWRAEHAARARRFLPPETGEPIAFEPGRDHDGEFERVRCRYAVADLVVTAVILRRVSPDAPWTPPPSVTVVQESSAASACANSIPAGHRSALFECGYLPDLA
jgi:hypothetical protein